MLHGLCLCAVLLLCLLVSKTSQENTVIRESCLRTTDTKVRMQLLESYFIQRKPLYSVEAVRFRTVKGNTICSHPSSLWAKKAIKHLNKKKKPKSGSNRSTNNSTNTSSTQT